jgi:hypothetical protein
VRGALWTLLLAVDFFLMSNPLVFIPAFDEALRDALVITAVFVLVELFWIRVPGVPWELLLFLAFAAVSSAWSLSPQATWYTVELYAFVGAVAVLIAANVTVPVLVDGLCLGGVLIVVLSFYALHAELPGAVVPAGGKGHMAGVGTNRNILAYTLVLSLAALVGVAPKTIPGWCLRLAGLGTVLIGIYLSSSGTGVFATLVVLASASVLALLDTFRSVISRTTKRLVQSGILAATVIVVLEARVVISWFGRDPSLSERVPLWGAILHVMHGEPLLFGYGWGAVWMHPWQIAPANLVLTRIDALSGFVAAHGHSSVFDVLPQLGLAGVLLGALMYGRTALRAWRARRPAPEAQALEMSRFLLVGLLGHLALGLTEPLFTIPVGWFVLVLLTQVRPRSDSQSGCRADHVPAGGTVGPETRQGHAAV